MDILISICARGGSKGIPGKNIKSINGKPLIAYTIEIAKKFQKKFNVKIGLSTDSLDIKTISENYCLFTNYIRPSFLATDQIGKIDTIKDLVLYEETLTGRKFDYILDLDVTSPLRTFEDLEKSFELLVNKQGALNLFSVNNANRNPYFNMVEEKPDGFCTLVKTNPGGTVMTRQSAPRVFDMNASFYWYRREFFDLQLNTAITDKSIFYLMDHICFDLDHPVDFLFMEYLLVNNKLGFEI